MIHYAFLDGSGVYVRQAGDAKSVPNGAVEAPFRSDRLIGMILIDGVWADRPRVGEPTLEYPVDGGMTVTFADLPIGTLAEVIDAETGEILASLAEEGGGLVVELVDAGGYLIEVAPPLPHLKQTLKVVL
jgi:hypothetical protein